MGDMSELTRAVRERPILFSGAMVPAILAGTKTQTRRVVKPQPWASCCIEEGMEGEPPFVYSALGGDGPGHDVHETRSSCRCPYGQPGDRLWVREAWRTTGDDGRCDDMPPRELQPHSVWYEADGKAPADECVGKLRPSMFMPRWACRLEIEVTDIRVERLQEVSEADAIAEGIVLLNGRYTFNAGLHESRSAVESYRALWKSINGAGSWDTNPWVWAVSFRRVESATSGATEKGRERQ